MTTITSTDLAIHAGDADSRVAILRCAPSVLQQIVLETFGAGPREFERIPMPTKGITEFSISTPAGVQHPKTLRVVVLAAHARRANWSGAYTGVGVAPDCKSHDGITGEGEPGGLCPACPLSQFDEAGGRPRCTETMDLTFIGLEDGLPSVLTVHKMSVKVMKDYQRSLRKYRMDLSAVITELGLKAAQYRNGMPYTLLTLQAIGVLSPAEQARMAAARRTFGFETTSTAPPGGAAAAPAPISGADVTIDIIPEHATIDVTSDTDTPPPGTDEEDVPV
jgi:hypothetical protein